MRELSTTKLIPREKGQFGAIVKFSFYCILIELLFIVLLLGAVSKTLMLEKFEIQSQIFCPAQIDVQRSTLLKLFKIRIKDTGDLSNLHCSDVTIVNLKTFCLSFKHISLMFMLITLSMYICQHLLQSQQ